MTVMKNDPVSKRAAALVHQVFDVLQRVDRAPATPVNAVLPPKLRREFRRSAARLRMGKTQPRYKNLYTAEELAEICERTVRRDEILEQASIDFQRIRFELGRVVEENAAEVGKTIEALAVEAKQSAEKLGPDSEAAQRYRYWQFMAWLGSRKRRQKVSGPLRIPLTSDPRVAIRDQRSAAEILVSPPSSDETVFAIPPEGRDSGRGRILIRIGIGESSWVGSFERGHTSFTTIFMMPDGEHLFVCAQGAGYVVDAKTRTLVEEIGTDIVGGIRDEPMTLLVVNHNNLSLEAFGKTGRLWKTRPIGSGGIRGMEIKNDVLFGEVRHPYGPGWAGFSVNLATGDVYLDGF